MSASVYALEPFNGELYAGGLFTEIGGVNTSYLARWNGTAWNSVASLITYMAADGLYANDTALFIGDLGRVRFWNGTNLYNLTGVSSASFNGALNSMAHFQDTLYVGGFFSSPLPHIAKWNGTSYDPLTTGCNAQVSKLAPFQGQLFACGNFLSPGIRWLPIRRCGMARRGTVGYRGERRCVRWLHVPGHPLHRWTIHRSKQLAQPGRKVERKPMGAGWRYPERLRNGHDRFRAVVHGRGFHYTQPHCTAVR